MSDEDWIWVIIGASIAAVIWTLRRGRAEPTVEEPAAPPERDNKLQKLLDELKDKLK